MNPNLWQNRTGSETERGTSWEYGEQRGSALSAALSVRSPSHTALTAGTKALRERAQTALPALHRTVPHITAAAPPQMSYRTHTKNPKPILEVRDLAVGPTAKPWREGCTCTSCVRGDSSLGEDQSQQPGSVSGSQRTVPEGWGQLALCLHCHGPAETRTHDVTELIFFLQEPGGRVKSKHTQNKC